MKKQNQANLFDVEDQSIQNQISKMIGNWFVDISITEIIGCETESVQVQ